MELYLMRHGKTEDNLAKVNSGQQDSPLAPIGIEQARQTGALLKDVEINAIYSSDLGRAMRTAELVNEARTKTVPIFPTPSLREKSFGIYEKRPYSETPPRSPAHMAVPLPGGESDEQMAIRVIDVLNRIYREHSSQSIAVVAHFGVVATVLASLEGISLYSSLERKIQNAGVIELDIEQLLSMPKLL